MGEARSGGGGVSYIYRLKSDHTEIQNAGGTAEATTTADAALVVGTDDGNEILIKTGMSYDDDGIPTINFEQTGSGEDVEGFLEVAAPKKAGSTSSSVEEVKSETGYKIGGSSGGSDTVSYLVISYGSSDGTNKTVKTHIITFKKSSGSQDWEAEKFVRPSIEGTGIAAKDTITIASGLFDAEQVSASAQTIGKDFYAKTFFMTPA